MTYSSEKLCLRWNDFQHNIVSSYQELHKGSDFSDVTLVCEEDKQFEAHRLILSACSPFFSRILKRNKHSHPMIYMRGIRANDMEDILDFIYLGEASIYQDNLESYLALAEELQLKGLAGLEDHTQNAAEDNIVKQKLIKPKIYYVYQQDNNYQSKATDRIVSHTNNGLIVMILSQLMMKNMLFLTKPLLKILN